MGAPVKDRLPPGRIHGAAMNTDTCDRITGDDYPDGMWCPLPALRGRDSATIEIPCNRRDALSSKHTGSYLTDDQCLLRNYLQSVLTDDVAVAVASLPAVRQPVHR